MPRPARQYPRVNLETRPRRSHSGVDTTTHLCRHLRTMLPTTLLGFGLAAAGWPPPCRASRIFASAASGALAKRRIKRCRTDVQYGAFMNVLDVQYIHKSIRVWNKMTNSSATLLRDCNRIASSAFRHDDAARPRGGAKCAGMTIRPAPWTGSRRHVRGALARRAGLRGGGV